MKRNEILLGDPGVSYQIGREGAPGQGMRERGDGGVLLIRERRVLQETDEASDQMIQIRQQKGKNVDRRHHTRRGGQRGYQLRTLSQAQAKLYPLEKAPGLGSRVAMDILAGVGQTGVQGSGQEEAE